LTLTKIILAVSENPILYDTSLESYSDLNRKNEAWKRVSEIVGLVDECRKKWRDLRDVYVRERREEKKRKTGAAATQKHPWRYYHIMSFLLPFVSSRPTSGNMEEERGEGRRNEEDSAEVITEERQEMQVGKDMTEIRNSLMLLCSDMFTDMLFYPHIKSIHSINLIFPLNKLFFITHLLELVLIATMHCCLGNQYQDKSDIDMIVV
uniref:MADF domain-containing protein n=1 Tax=Sinocyclocheilus anshuiensis TaxID=1608454 RepID=A0A671RTL2_9TELE